MNITKHDIRRIALHELWKREDEKRRREEDRIAAMSEDQILDMLTSIDPLK